jgi:membrane protease YdiL (CAAX protease family)
MGRNAAIAQLLPSTEAERLTWLVVAVSVGFCEEVVYRGYLQTQLAAFTRSRTLGVALQAALFGIAHLEQGPASALRIGAYGLVLGVLASARGSLLPGMLCHIGIDLASGLLR